MKCPHCGHPNIDDCRTSKNKARRTSCLMREIANLKAHNNRLLECGKARDREIEKILSVAKEKPIWPDSARQLMHNLYLLQTVTHPLDPKEPK
jgi:hypothetical protein